MRRNDIEWHANEMGNRDIEYQLPSPVRPIECLCDRSENANTQLRMALAQAVPATKSAAFYDVDGTLIKTNIVHAFAWYARHQPTLTGSLVKSAKTALSIPMFMIADKLSRKVFNQLFYGYYAGEPEDRLIVLAEELFEDVIKPSIFP